MPIVPPLLMWAHTATTDARIKHANSIERVFVCCCFFVVVVVVVVFVLFFPFD